MDFSSILSSLVVCTAFLASGCQSSGPDHAPVTVMTFNIRYDNPADGPDAWPLRANWVASTIRESGAEVVGIQEALRHQVDTLSALLPEYAWIGVGRDDGASGGEFSPVFYRTDSLRVISWDTIWLSESPGVPGSVGWDAALPRVATRATLARPDGRDFMVVNVHFDHRGVEARRRAALLLIDSLSTADRAVLMGDFNVTDTTRAYQALAAGGWSDAFRAGVSEGPEATFSGFEVGGAEGGRIDHVFVRGFRVDRYAARNRTRAGRYVSDHRPVVVSLR